ncbi:hypothetical protein TWF192_005213 [Orbilia oligospora]|uniref:C2H2-type domain-containing protein n=1 Tax=Orbilia oligospora TaxID=2813651 RepID=A0A6G1MB39_ORBOL|nr:hypothetical protein TWF191_004561 [Orbilia oligospora]KAF3250774.1 hypothetical protein TWF192_005213 [Orbilia oligospora]
MTSNASSTPFLPFPLPNTTANGFTNTPPPPPHRGRDLPNSTFLTAMAAAATLGNFSGAGGVYTPINNTNNSNNNNNNTPTGHRGLDVHEIIQSASKHELQNFLTALIKSDNKNKERLQKFHFQSTQLREQKQRLLHLRAEADTLAAVSVTAAAVRHGQANNASASASASASTTTSNSTTAETAAPPPPPRNITNVNAANSTRKRKAETNISVCITCLKSYDEADNHLTACRTHPGPWEADMDHDMWGDMYEGDFCGRDENHEDFFNDRPDAFIMQCCGDRGDTPGCEVFRHVSRFSSNFNNNSNGNNNLREGGGRLDTITSVGVVSGSGSNVRKRRVREPEYEDPYGEEDEDEDGEY